MRVSLHKAGVANRNGKERQDVMSVVESQTLFNESGRTRAGEQRTTLVCRGKKEREQ